MDWDKATDIVLYAAIATVGVFVVLGLYQWITRKSLKKVDRSLLLLIIPLGLMAIVYVLFDKFIVLNTRPDGSGEPSFPSTHAMVIATIFACTAIVLPQYLKSKTLCAVLDVVLLAFTILASVGRVLANKHWASDVIAGLVFAAVFAGTYFFLVRTFQKRHNHQKGTKNE